MKCEDCGTEDPGAPSYKPACLIEQDVLRARVAELETICDHHVKATTILERQVRQFGRERDEWRKNAECYRKERDAVTSIADALARGEQAALSRVGVLEAAARALVDSTWPVDGDRYETAHETRLVAALRAVLLFAEGAVNEAAGWSAKDEQEGRAAVRAARAALAAPAAPREPKAPDPKAPERWALCTLDNPCHDGFNGWTHAATCKALTVREPKAPERGAGWASCRKHGREYVDGCKACDVARLPGDKPPTGEITVDSGTGTQPAREKGEIE